jgi:hypothetical protein
MDPTPSPPPPKPRASRAAIWPPSPPINIRRKVYKRKDHFKPNVLPKL